MLLNLVRLALVLTLSLSTAYSQTAAESAEQRYKNILVLKGVPAAEITPAMGFIATALGVQCQFCHAGTFDQDTKPAKQTARRMIEMTRALNAGSFNGKQEVTCYTCHQGRSKPVSTPPAFSGTISRPEPTTSASALPTLDDVLARYMRALGGKTALDKFSTRVMDATQTIQTPVPQTATCFPSDTQRAVRDLDAIPSHLSAIEMPQIGRRHQNPRFKSSAPPPPVFGTTRLRGITRQCLPPKHQLKLSLEMSSFLAPDRSRKADRPALILNAFRCRPLTFCAQRTSL